MKLATPMPRTGMMRPRRSSRRPWQSTGSKWSHWRQVSHLPTHQTNTASALSSQTLTVSFGSVFCKQQYRLTMVVGNQSCSAILLISPRTFQRRWTLLPGGQYVSHIFFSCAAQTVSGLFRWLSNPFAHCNGHLCHPGHLCSLWTTLLHWCWDCHQSPFLSGCQQVRATANTETHMVRQHCWLCSSQLNHDWRRIFGRVLRIP